MNTEVSNTYTTEVLFLSNMGLTELPHDIHLYTNLQALYCGNNQLTSLVDNLPASLSYLDCANNQLTSLDNLPASLSYLNCCNNQLTSLVNLPTSSLFYLDCTGNQLTCLENLPTTLQYFYCYNNPLVYEFEPTLRNIREYNKQNIHTFRYVLK